ncbi:unnamed protein product [Moneuplotes crassus]|uniref:Uncharacterized protein n=1 Tax=Euplotes crassus TaxID=5936 RepID=A0AAD1Y4B9_EUPCR|nr:unnamed protein product [Moneuplotes crassus]
MNTKTGVGGEGHRDDLDVSENFINDQQFSNVDENPTQNNEGKNDATTHSARYIKPFHFKSHIEVQSPLMKDQYSLDRKEKHSFKYTKNEYFKESSSESLDSKEILNDTNEHNGSNRKIRISDQASLKFSEGHQDLGGARRFELVNTKVDDEYTNSQEMQKPENTPEVSKSMSDQRIPNKKELTKNITKKPIKSNYHTYRHKNKKSKEFIAASATSKSSKKKSLVKKKLIPNLNNSQNVTKKLKKYDSHKQLHTGLTKESKSKDCKSRKKLSKIKSVGGLSLKKQSVITRRNITTLIKPQRNPEKRNFNKFQDLSFKRKRRSPKILQPFEEEKSQCLTKSIEDSLSGASVHKRLNDLGKKCRNSINSTLEPRYSYQQKPKEVKSLAKTRNKHTKNSEMAQTLSFRDLFKKCDRSWMNTGSNRKDKTFNGYLYTGEAERKSRQENQESELSMYKNHSVRSFLKNVNSSFSHKNYALQTSRSKQMLSGEKPERVSTGKLEHGAFSKFNKCPSAADISHGIHTRNQQFISYNKRSKISLNQKLENSAVFSYSKGSVKPKDEISFKVEKDKECKSKIDTGLIKRRTKAKINYNDKFKDLYEKARLRKRNQKKEVEVKSSQKDSQEIFIPQISEQEESEEDNSRENSKRESIPEVTKTDAIFDKADLQYVNQRIQDIENQRREESSFDEKDSLSSAPITIENGPNVRNKLIETPKTEELEEEMRDQVLDYQSLVYNNFNTNREGYYNDQFPEDKETEYIDHSPELDDSPLLFVDVNLGPDKAERIVVFEGDTADDLAFRFSQRHDLNDIMRAKLTNLLKAEISSLSNEL